MLVIASSIVPTLAFGDGNVIVVGSGRSYIKKVGAFSSSDFLRIHLISPFQVIHDDVILD
jgi:hypothetical protein